MVPASPQVFCLKKEYLGGPGPGKPFQEDPFVFPGENGIYNVVYQRTAEITEYHEERQLAVDPGNIQDHREHDQGQYGKEPNMEIDLLQFFPDSIVLVVVVFPEDRPDLVLERL